MGKIMRYEELNLKKNEQVLYSETYEVKFWIKKDDGFWKQDSLIYHAKTKAEHESVLKRWKLDFKGKEVKIIGVTYQ
jgi:hypothetical protein